MLARGVVLGSSAALVFLALGACGSSKRAGNGGECFVTTDCQEPLVCVEQKDKSRVCSDNLDSVVGDLPPEAAAPETDASDASPSETSTTPPRDSGSPPQDSGGD